MTIRKIMETDVHSLSFHLRLSYYLMFHKCIQFLLCHEILKSCSSERTGASQWMQQRLITAGEKIMSFTCSALSHNACLITNMQLEATKRNTIMTSASLKYCSNYDKNCFSGPLRYFYCFWFFLVFLRFSCDIL